MSSDEFGELLRRVRTVIDRQYGPTTSKPFLMLCDLLEILDKSKVDRVSSVKDVDSSS